MYNGIQPVLSIQMFLLKLLKFKLTMAFFSRVRVPLKGRIASTMKCLNNYKNIKQGEPRLFVPTPEMCTQDKHTEMLNSQL